MLYNIIVSTIYMLFKEDNLMNKELELRKERLAKARNQTL